jgi:hypothetical protein
VIPGTKQRVSRTQESEQIENWMEKTGHLPMMYMREHDGIHCEISELFEKRFHAALENGCAVGEDKRQYKLDNTKKPFTMCGSICVRATPEGSEHSEAYDITFFV